MLRFFSPHWEPLLLSVGYMFASSLVACLEPADSQHLLIVVFQKTE